MGLLDNLFAGDAGQQGLLAGASALMAAGGPSRMPVGLGQALAQGLGAGQQAYQGAQEFALQKQLRDMQMQAFRAKTDDEQRKRTQEEELRNLAAQFNITPQAATARSMGPTMDGGVVPQVSPGYDFAGYANALASRDPAKALDLQLKLKKEGPEYSQTPQYDQSGRAFVLSKDGTLKYLDGIKHRDELVSEDLGGQKVFRTKYSADPLGTLNKTQTPDSKASNALGWANNALSRERLSQETTSAGFSPAAIENAAARYNVDGTLPPMGMGKSGSAGRQAILNRAAEIALGTPGTDQRINQLDAKSAAMALNQVSKSKAMNAAFERNAQANAQIALELSDKLDRTGVPLLNAGIQAWRTGSGSPEATQFAAANDTFVAEYAKIMSGGMGNSPVSDSARHKAESLLKTSMTKEQYKGNVALLKREMGNRMTGFDQEEAALRKRIGGGKETPSAGPPSASDIDAEIARRKAGK